MLEPIQQDQRLECPVDGLGCFAFVEGSLYPQGPMATALLLMNGDLVRFVARMAMQGSQELSTGDRVLDGLRTLQFPQFEHFCVAFQGLGANVFRPSLTLQKFGTLVHKLTGLDGQRFTQATGHRSNCAHSTSNYW